LIFLVVSYSQCNVLTGHHYVLEIIWSVISALLLPTDECFAQEVPEPVYEGLTCPKYAQWDSNPGSWLAKEQKSWLRFGGRRLLLLNDVQGNLIGDQYIRDVLQPVVVPHFDNHPLATRLVYMDDNAKPHRSRAVTAYLRSEAMTSVRIVISLSTRHL
jgi:hypothetical protein